MTIPATITCEDCGDVAKRKEDNVLTKVATFECENGHRWHYDDGDVERL